MAMETRTAAHDAPETPHIVVERMELTGKGAGAAYDWRREPPGEPVEREKKPPDAGGVGESDGGENQYAPQYAPIIAQNAGAVKPRTRRETILTALDAMGEAVETAGFFIVASATGCISVQLYDAPVVFDAMVAARPGVAVTFRRMTGNYNNTFRRSVVIGGVEFFQFLSVEEAARHGIS